MCPTYKVPWVFNPASCESAKQVKVWVSATIPEAGLKHEISGSEGGKRREQWSFAVVKPSPLRFLSLAITRHHLSPGKGPGNCLRE